MEFKARVLKGVLVPNEPTTLPEGREVVLSLVEVSDEAPEKTTLELLLDQLDAAYDQLGLLLSQRSSSKSDDLEEQISAAQQQIKTIKQQRAQCIEAELSQQRSVVDEWEVALTEAKKYAKELHEASSNDTTP